MTEPTEQSTHHKRDMSRPHWQLSTGVVLAQEIIGPVFEQQIPDLTMGHIKMIEGLAWEDRRIRLHNELNGAWACAYAVSQHSMNFYPSAHEHILNDPIIADQLIQHTSLGGAPSDPFHEAVTTQQIFPINLAREVHLAAIEQGVDGFEAKTLGDIADILQRPDFQTLVLDSTVTRQGIWKAFSWSVGTPFRGPEGINMEFEFHNGQVTFTPKFSQFLRDELKKVNQHGLTREEAHRELGKMASGRCLGAHTKPNFTHKQQDKEQLAHLSRLFRKSPEKLTAARYPTPETPRTLIHVGLDKTAEWLRVAEPHIDTTKFDRQPKEPKKTLKQRILGRLGLQKDVKAPDSNPPKGPKQELNMSKAPPTIAQEAHGKNLEITTPPERLTPEIIEVKLHEPEFSAPSPLEMSEREVVLRQTSQELAAEQRRVAAELALTQQQQALELEQTLSLEPER